MSRQQREEILRRFRQPPTAERPTVQQMRAGFAALMSGMHVADGIRTSAGELAGRATLVVDPVAPAERGTILYFHGGSFSLGSPETALSLTSALVVRTHKRALSLDYRLAPEHPFPAGLQDAFAAYLELLDAGHDPATIVFAGDSAGGGIAVGTCLMARAAGVPRPAAVVAFSAGLDATRTGASMRSKDGVDPFFTLAGLRATGALYVNGQEPDQELLSPAIRADMSGFPPLLLQVGTAELLLDDSTRLAERARAAGVDVILDVTADVPHVFQAFTTLLDEADQALDRAALFIRQHVPA
jgi:acetyl esterase/lipase